MFTKKILALFFLIEFCFSPLAYAVSEKIYDPAEKPAEEVQGSENTVVPPAPPSPPEPAALPLTVNPNDQINPSNGEYEYYGRRGRVCWVDSRGRRHCRWR